jgi:PAS domain S-box-containing protein
MSEQSAQFDLEDFFENGAIPLHLVGPDGTILKANRAELAFLGYAADEYVGRNIADFHADRATSADILSRLSRGEVIRRYEARLRAKDGSLKDVLIDSSGHFQDGKLVNTRCFTQDFTGQKALEAERLTLVAGEREARERAEQLNRAKDQFLVTLSHELRTPLNAVLGWARILEAEALSPDKVRHAAEVISRNASLQARLVEELLDLSRVVSGKFRIEARSLNIASVVEAAAEAFKPAATAKGIHFQIVLDARGDRSSAIRSAPAGRVESHLECDQVHQQGWSGAGHPPPGEFPGGDRGGGLGRGHRGRFPPLRIRSLSAGGEYEREGAERPRYRPCRRAASRAAAWRHSRSDERRGRSRGRVHRQIAHHGLHDLRRARARFSIE